MRRACLTGPVSGAVIAVVAIIALAGSASSAGAWQMRFEDSDACSTDCRSLLAMVGGFPSVPQQYWRALRVTVNSRVTIVDESPIHTGTGTEPVTYSWRASALNGVRGAVTASCRPPGDWWPDPSKPAPAQPVRKVSFSRDGVFRLERPRGAGRGYKCTLNVLGTAQLEYTAAPVFASFKDIAIEVVIRPVR